MATTSNGNDQAPGTDPARVLTEEISTYRARLAELLDHEGEFVLIKGRDIIGFFPERRLAQREAYRRFGIVPFLVKLIEPTEAVFYIPNVIP